MSRSIEEIAGLLDDAHESLMIMARAAVGKGNELEARVIFASSDGKERFSLADLAQDLRAIR